MTNSKLNAFECCYNIFTIRQPLVWQNRAEADATFTFFLPSFSFLSFHFKLSFITNITKTWSTKIQNTFIMIKLHLHIMTSIYKFKFFIFYFVIYFCSLFKFAISFVCVHVHIHVFLVVQSIYIISAYI